MSTDIEITLISPRGELHYLPGIIWIPKGLRTREDLVIPLGNFFRCKNVIFHHGSVTGPVHNGRTVTTDDGTVVNDGLITASGGRFIQQLPCIAHAVTPCVGVDAAESFRDRLNTLTDGTMAFGFTGNPEGRSAIRSN